MEPITLKFTLDREDCIETIRLTTFKRRRIMHGFLVSLAIVVGVLPVFIEINEGAMLWNWLFITFIILGLLYEYVLHPIIFTRRLEKAERIPVEMTLIADGSGIDSVSKLGRNRVGWSEFGGIQELEDYFFLTHKGASQMVEIIPKRAFESEEQAQAFRELAEGQIKK
ncbi:MAG: YcxB family protein [Anaerolineae bacterium]|nr:YcxB family protein [Anaerolineae bacterium]